MATTNEYLKIALAKEINSIVDRITKLKERKENQPATAKGRAMKSVIKFTIQQATENVEKLKKEYIKLK